MSAQRTILVDVELHHQRSALGNELKSNGVFGIPLVADEDILGHDGQNELADRGGIDSAQISLIGCARGRLTQDFRGNDLVWRLVGPLRNNPTIDPLFQLIPFKFPRFQDRCRPGQGGHASKRACCS
jgi:hypothetical protein